MALQWTKQQQFKEPCLNEIHIEPDGTKWEHVFHHNNPSQNLFASGDDFANGIFKNENMWFNFNVCNLISSEWEILYCQSTIQGGAITKYRWIQTANPFIATYDNVKPTSVTRITTTGYTDGGNGGLFKKNSKTFFAIASSSSSAWWGSTGSWTAYQNGIGGYPEGEGVITTGCVDIYVRVDSISNEINKLYKNGIWVTNNLYEY